MVILFLAGGAMRSDAQNLVNSGQINNTGTIRVKGQATGLPTSLGGVFELFGGAQTVPSTNYGDLILAGTGTKTTAAGDFNVTGSLTINSGITLSVESSSTITLGGSLSEQGYLSGKIKKIVSLSGQTSSSTFGGIGMTITWSGTAPGSTAVTRSSGVASSGNGNESIKRYYDIAPTTNSGLNATLVFKYADSELNGQSAATLELWKSTNGGTTWIRKGGTVDTIAKTITISGVTSFSLWTAADAAHPVGVAAIYVNTKIYLEGPYSGSTMSTGLNSGGYIPTSQPYNTAPWNYAGSESVSSIPAGLVDWVLVELRTTSNGSAVSTRAAFVKSDGTVVDTDGTSAVSFSDAAEGSYYVVIRHRNHLAIMSASAVSLSSNSSLYDFTTGQGQAYGTNAMKEVSAGVFGLWAGDTNGDGQVNATDRSNTYNDRNLTGYLASDVSLDGQTNATDRSITYNNRNKVTQVP